MDEKCPPMTLSDLKGEICRLKKSKNAIILAHYYQESEIQDLADYLGDSLKLAQEAQKTKADVIVFCGVHFMAQTAKILNPNKTVVLPDLDAGCSLADSCPADLFEKFTKKHSDHIVISYVNCSAEVKALSDIICTSSNAKKIINSIPKDQPIIFAPDYHLGRYLQKVCGREMLLWDGTCIVHEIFNEQALLDMRKKHPSAKLLAHPECEEAILRHADHIGSTSSILHEAINGSCMTYIVATESGILHQMQKNAPHKKFITAPTTQGCACNYCPHMRKNTIEKLYLALKNLQPQIYVDEKIRTKALAPLDRMLKISV